MERPVSENALLAMINRHFPNAGFGIELGRGDDCAIFQPSNGLCVTSDLFLEDVHFRHAYFTPQDIGWKALAVNLSDLAACGAIPLGFSLCLGLPEWTDINWLKDFFQGMAALATPCQAILIGGDISRSDKTHISITAYGHKAPGCDFLTRGASLPGDYIFIAGHPGLARIGLEELESTEKPLAKISWPHACAAHLRPVPRLETGRRIAEIARKAERISLMDVSDGLAADIPRLLGNFGCELAFSPENLHQEVITHAKAKNRDPFKEAFLGGEDYALAGACNPEAWPDLQKLVPELVILGKVTEKQGIFINGKDASQLKGFDHFQD